MPNALKSINDRVKVLQKKHPKSKRTTLQKQAGREWKAGKLKKRKKTVGAVRKKTVRKRKAVKRKVVRRKAASKTKIIVRVVKAKRRKYAGKTTKVKAYKAKRYRRVSGSGKSIMPMVAIGALALGAVYLLTRNNTASQYQYQPTGNYQRDNSANSILTWATAAGIGASAIAKIIEALNRSSDATVTNAAANPNDYVQQFLGGD